MAFEFKDYYHILGVSRNAGDEEIRKAFRKLARLYHPDIAGEDRRAEDRFKEINEAYEVLGDPGKRQRYDEFNDQWRSGGQYANPPGWDSFTKHSNPDSSGRAEHFTFTGTGFSDFFEQLFGPNPQSHSRASSERIIEPEPGTVDSSDSEGDDLEADIWVTLSEAAQGAIRPITLRRSVPCPRCFGLGQYNAHTCEQCDGKGHTIRTDEYKVKIPKGVAEGASLRVAGHGDKSPGNGRPGDLYLKVRYARHPDFKVEHGQLIYEMELAPWEAVLGTSILVPTLGPGVQMKIPPGTQNGQKFRLQNKGLPQLDGSSGDMIVVIRIQVPKETTPREQMLWRELAASSSFRARDN